MIQIKQEALQLITGGVHPHLFVSALGTIGVAASFYLLQKNGVSFTHIMCHLGCATSGGISCVCAFSSSISTD